jgi:alkanesulfonate monooxygenase SsuD/methylene tetrahydromethanopterin reductase-like flavin-dependent oxidoreductase (luciferase family)
MKLSFTHYNVYTDSAVTALMAPVAPRLYDPKEGSRSLEFGWEQVRLADSLGFDYISVSEHHRWPVLQCPNAAITAGALTQIVKNARLLWAGPLVSINNPIRIAEEIAMLDQMSHGRVAVALLRGTPNEFGTYNNLRPEDSRAVTEEAALLIRRALSEREAFAHKGRFFDFPDTSIWPGSTQRPHAPLWTSGNSEDSVRFAARNRFLLAISFYPPEMVARLAALYRQECAAAGWAPDADTMLYRSFIVVGEDDAHAAELRRRFLSSPAFDVAARTNSGDSPDEKGKDKSALGFGLGFIQFSGGPKSVIEQILSFRERTGMNFYDLAFYGGGLNREETLSMIRRFGSSVMPELQRSARV